jgi:hypothetical protein
VAVSILNWWHSYLWLQIYSGYRLPKLSITWYQIFKPRSIIYKFVVIACVMSKHLLLIHECMFFSTFPIRIFGSAISTGTLAAWSSYALLLRIFGILSPSADAACGSSQPSGDFLDRFTFSADPMVFRVVSKFVPVCQVTSCSHFLLDRAPRIFLCQNSGVM